MEKKPNAKSPPKKPAADDDDPALDAALRGMIGYDEPDDKASKRPPAKGPPAKKRR